MQDNSSFDDINLHNKKLRFLFAVANSARSNDMLKPHIEFHKNRCPLSEGNRDAHIHPAMHAICICENPLLQMSFEQIEEVATQQVTRLVDQAPSSRFIKKKSSEPKKSVDEVTQKKSEASKADESLTRKTKEQSARKHKPKRAKKHKMRQRVITSQTVSEYKDIRKGLMVHDVVSTKKKRSKKQTNIITALILLVILALVAFTVYQIFFSKTVVETPTNEKPPPPEVVETEPEEPTITIVKVPMEINFSALFSDWNSQLGSPINVTGRIMTMREGETIKVKKFIITDDYGKDLCLRQLTLELQALFPEDKLSEGLYEVHGTMSTDEGRPAIMVSSLEEGEREVKLQMISESS